MPDALPEYAQQAADDLRALIQAVPLAQRPTAIAIAKAGARFGIEMSRGDVLPGDDILKVRDRQDAVIPDA